MTVRRHLTKRLRDLGSYRALCPVPPPFLGGGDNDDADWVACLLLSSGNGSIVASTLRWLTTLSSPSGGEGERGGARRLTEFLAGVRRASIEAGRYKAG